MKIQINRCFLLLLIFTFGRHANAVSATGTMARYLVLISIDSCRPDYLDLVPTPNIDKLKKEGAYFNNSWVGQLNNDTPPGHTAISTGTFGKHNGIISFNWQDPRWTPSNKSILLSISRSFMAFIRFTGWTDLGLWYQGNVMRKVIERNWPTSWEGITSGRFTNLIVETGVPSIGGLYKKANPGAKVAAISADKWYACAALAAGTADYTIFADATGIPPITYNSVTKIKPAGIKANPPPNYIMNDARLVRDVKDESDTDTWAVDVALAVIEKTRPEILLINLPATDDAGHATGGINAPKKMAEVIANVDKQIGRITDDYKKAGKYDQTVFVILSDHGMTPYTKIIHQSVLDKLYIEMGNPGIATPHLGFLYEEKTKDVAEKITNANIPGIHGAYYKVRIADGSYKYEPTTATKAKITGDLAKCYDYLFSTYANEKSPMGELILAENRHLDWRIMNVKPFHGNHDSASWHQQHTLLLIAGPGIKKGTVSKSPSRLVDVAPTVLTLMGVVPERMDGIVLADALQAPTDRQRQVQAKLNGELTPMVEALKARSKEDLAELNKE